MIWTKYCGTATKVGGNRENKPDPAIMEVSCLLEKVGIMKLALSFCPILQHSSTPLLRHVSDFEAHIKYYRFNTKEIENQKYQEIGKSMICHGYQKMGVATRTAWSMGHEAQIRSKWLESQKQAKRGLAVGNAVGNYNFLNKKRSYKIM